MEVDCTRAWGIAQREWQGNGGLVRIRADGLRACYVSAYEMLEQMKGERP